MERPYTTQDLFEKILTTLNDENKLPDILDYALSSSSPVQELRNYEFAVNYCLEYGSSEGIYVNIYIEGNWGQEDDNCHKLRIGCCKTLLDSEEAMLKMAELGAWFIIRAYQFIREDIDNFTWQGYTIEFQKENSKVVKIDCFTKERVLEQLNLCGTENYSEIIVRNNTTRQKWLKKDLKDLERD